ncbi:MAG: hypothetical protein ACRC8D_08555 [Aeromonas sp.]
MPELINFLIAIVVILALVLAVIFVKVHILTNGHFLTEQRLTDHINKMGDAISGHRRDTSDTLGRLAERLRRLEKLAETPAPGTVHAPTPAQSITAELQLITDAVVGGDINVADAGRAFHAAIMRHRPECGPASSVEVDPLVDTLKALQEGFLEKGAILSYKLVWPPKKP